MSLLAAIPLQRIEVLVAAILICVVIFELVRRRHLMERYALLWLLAGIGLMVLALWQGLLTTVSGWVGIYYPPAALFAAGFVFVLAILLQFSIAISRLSDQNKILAQRVALLQQQLEREQAEKTGEEQAEKEPNEGLAPRR
jgi:hypothetical protein